MKGFDLNKFVEVINEFILKGIWVIRLHMVDR